MDPIATSAIKKSRLKKLTQLKTDGAPGPATYKGINSKQAYKLQYVKCSE